MARINDGTLKDWKDGDKVTSDLYEADREIIRVANNDNHDRITILEDDKPVQDKRLDDLEYNVTGTVVPMTFKELGMQNLTFDDIKLGYVDQAIAKAWKPSLDTLTRGIVEESIAVEGQTLINLTNSYTVGSNQITVEIDGVPQDESSYTETSSTRVTLSEALVAGQRIVVTIGKVDPNTDARFSSMSTEIDGLTISLTEKVKSTSIKEIRDNANIFEYTLDGLLWKQVMSGGSGGTTAFALINDYGADATGVNDSLAAFNTALATGKPVTALPGTYKVTGTIVVPRKATMILHGGVTIKPSGNFNVIQIKPESKIYGNGCMIDSSGITSFTMAGIYATGQDRFSVSNELTIVDGFNVKGKDHESDVGGSSTNYTGKGIHFYSGNNWAAGFAGQAYIAYIQVSNINISSVYRGIWLEREKAPINGNPWITSCTFDQINMYAAMRSIDITTNNYFYNGGHLFTNLQLQANNFTERYIYTDGSNNRFVGEFWDVEDYFESRNVPCFEFNDTAHENTIEGTQFFVSGRHYIDRNSIQGYSSNVNPMKPNRVTGIVNPVNILPPTSTNGIRRFIGDQDDILAGASKAYTITTSKVPANGATSVPNAFSPNKGTFLSFTGADETNNITLEIDFSTAPIAELDMVGFVFRRDSNMYIPKYIKIEPLDATGTVIPDSTNSVNYNDSGSVYLSTYASTAYKLRITFGSSNDSGANRTIRIYRIFATSIAASGKTWLNTSDGGTVYGDTNFLGYTYLGKVTSLPTASATYRGKTIRVEGGTGVADNLYMCMKSATDTYSWKVITTG